MDTSIAEELYAEVFKAGTEICLVYSTVVLDLETQLGNKKSRNRLYSELESSFVEAIQEAGNGEFWNAQSITKPFDEYDVFHWCRTKREFVEVVERIYGTLAKHKKADAYYPCGNGRAVGLQIHVDY